MNSEEKREYKHEILSESEIFAELTIDHFRFMYTSAARVSTIFPHLYVGHQSQYLYHGIKICNLKRQLESNTEFILKKRQFTKGDCLYAGDKFYAEIFNNNHMIHAGTLDYSEFPDRGVWFELPVEKLKEQNGMKFCQSAVLEQIIWGFGTPELKNLLFVTDFDPNNCEVVMDELDLKEATQILVLSEYQRSQVRKLGFSQPILDLSILKEFYKNCERKYGKVN